MFNDQNDLADLALIYLTGGVARVDDHDGPHVAGLPDQIKQHFWFEILQNKEKCPALIRYQKIISKELKNNKQNSVS